MKMKVIISVALMCMCLYGEAARILVVSPGGTKSHTNSYVLLTKELAKRGHNVTVICNYQSTDLQNREGVQEIWMQQLAIDYSKYPSPFQTAVGNLTRQEMKTLLGTALGDPLKRVTAFFEDARIQNLIANSQFDLVIGSVLTYFISLPLSWHFNVPIITTIPNVLLPGWGPILGDSDHTEYVPMILSGYTDKMSFFDRTINTVGFFIYSILNDYSLWGVNEVVQKNIPGCPSLAELEDRVDVVFTNSHPSINYPRILPPSVIEIGAIQCVAAKPLPPELEEFVSSPEGFILFSIGSLLPMNDMPEYMIEIFVKVFSALPQRVIWQWKGTPKQDLPENIKTLGWLPQQDLLGHKNCRLFITHGGLNSIQEAIYHGVPLLGLPFGTDQHLNMARASKNGYALKMDWKNLTEETLSESVRELLHNSSYSDSIQKLSLLLRDEMQTPLERAAFWTEFVLRHNGVKHLRLASRNLLPFQRALVDVYAALFIATTLPIVLVFFCIRRCCRSKTRATNLLKKNQ